MRKATALLCCAALAVGLALPAASAKYKSQTDYSLTVITTQLTGETKYYGYGYTYQSFVASSAGYYAVQLYGADGGAGHDNPGSEGLGAAITGIIWMDAGQQVWLYIGGPGTDGSTSSSGAAAINGGGGGGYVPPGGVGGGASGGGAACLRIDGVGYEHRAMVAAGGGGGGAFAGSGGHAGSGGGIAVTSGNHSGIAFPGTDGTGTGNGTAGTHDTGGVGGFSTYQADHGYLAQGGNAHYQGGGGGGGLFGGGGGAGLASDAGGGGGGSSFIADSVYAPIPDSLLGALPKPVHEQNYYKNGWAYGIITYIGTTLPAGNWGVFPEATPSPTHSESASIGLLEDIPEEEDSDDTEEILPEEGDGDMDEPDSGEEPDSLPPEASSELDTGTSEEDGTDMDDGASGTSEPLPGPVHNIPDTPTGSPAGRILPSGAARLVWM